MKLRVRLSSLVWIHVILFARCKGDPICHVLDHDSSEFRVSAGGYFTDNLTQDLCKQLCAEQKFLYIGLLLGEYCLCGNSIEDFTEVDASSCNTYCSGNTDEVCGSNDTNLIYTMEATFIGTIDNITIAIDDRTFLTNEPVQMEMIVEASTKAEVVIQFDDGSFHTLTDEPFVIEKYYQIPGEYIVHAAVYDTTGVNPPIFDEKVITVEERNTMFEITCPRVAKPGEQSNCSLIVSSGSLLMMNYEMNGEVSAEFELPEPFYASTGLPAPPVVDESTRIDISLDKVYMTHAKFKFDGRLLGFEYYVKDKGKFFLLVLTPECDSGSYCEETSDCSTSCQAYNIRKCNSDKVFCSPVGQCINTETPSDCSPVQSTGLKYKVKHSFEVDEKNAGYKYFEIPSTSEKMVQQGDIIGFQTDGTSSLWCRNSSEAELENKVEDFSDDVGIGVLHFLKAIATEPVNITLGYIYNKTANYTVSVTVTDSSSDQSDTKYLPVQIPISDVSIEIDKVNIVVGQQVSACIKGNGSNLNVLWDYLETNEKEYFEDPIPEEGIFKNIPCLEGGEYTLSANLSNLWNSEYVSVNFQCFLSIGRNWSLSSDSPKSTPPGTISFDLKFDGEMLPGFSAYVVDFGDDSVTDTKEIASESDEWQTFSHDYKSEGNFTVSINISNPVDFEIFELPIRIFEKMGNLTVVPFFVESGSYPEDKSELKGRDKVDVPVDSTVYFENDIAGHVTYYKMTFDDGSYNENYSDSIISHLFSVVGEHNISFRAWNSHLEEYSNDVKLFVRILADVSDFDFSASSSNTEVDEEIKFRITLSQLDDFTCIMYNGGDNGRLLGFGNKDVCTLYYKEGQFKFIKKPAGGSSRKRRETIEAEWEDDYIISILYCYAFGGEFPASVDVFNSVSRKRKDVTVIVSDGDYKTPLVWIDKNSTDIDTPIECHRGYDCRYETTAVFRSNLSYLASHSWTAFMISADGQEEEVDLTSLKTHNCSAIRIVKRTLDFGLYKLRYTLTVYDEDENKQQSNSSNEESEEEELYEDYYYRAARMSTEDEEKDFNIMFENHTILGQRSVYSFLRIVPTPLVPMMIKGGASYLVRGFDQKVFLEPALYTVDPDYPEDQNYDVTWFCLRSDLDESLTELGKYDYDTSNPSAPITDRSTIKEEDYAGGCFGKGPGLIKIATSDYEIHTNSFWTYDAVYKVIAVIKKDGKVTETHIRIEVVRGTPPSLCVMCDKKTACFPEVRGLFINPSAWVPLKVECLENCGSETSRYDWEIFASDLQTWERKEIKDWKKHVSIDFDRLGLNQSLYSENPDVGVFLVEATKTIPDTDFPMGMSSLFLLVNHPPKNGQCRLSSQSGMALLDVFTVEFSDWEDEDGHEFADYSVYVKYGEEYLRLSYGLKAKVNIVLPFGNLEILCSVEDEIGATTVISSANITTQLPTEKQLAEYENKRFFDKCLAEGKMSLASQVVIAKNSVIIEYKKRNNNEGDFGDVSDRAVDAQWREYLELDGIDSSYFTPQAREEILEKLREEMEEQMDRDSKLKNEELNRLLRLPMEALPDAEVYGGALSAVAANGPTDFSGKLKIMKGLDSMFQVINDTDVPHPENKKIVFSQFGDLADTIAGSLAESNIGGNFLPFELKQAEEVLDYNATEPNYFIFYIEGNRSEVERNLKDRAVDAAKGNHMDEAKGMVTKIKEMVSAIQMSSMEEIMVGSEPFYTNTRSGFQMTFLKNYASNLSGATIEQGGSSVVLPDLCKVLNIDRCAESDLAIGVQSVRWTQPLESYGTGSSKLSENSNVIQVEVTPREGNTTIPIENSTEPFKICMPVSSASDTKMDYIVPSFTRSDDILVYHTLLMDSPGLAATVNIKPDDLTAPLVVLYSYGELPSLIDYNYISRIQDIPFSKGMFSLFIGSWVIRNSGKNLSVGIGHAANTTDLDLFFANPGKYNLSVVNMTNKFSTNYAIEILTTGCYYFSDSEEKWSTKGCEVVESNSDSTCCECNHLTSFGSGFFITPNEINFSYVFAHADFKTNITIYATLIVTFSAFILLLIYAKWKDRKDLQKLGATPLPDNEAADKYIYEILIFTGHQRNAGTKSNVYFIVSGEDDETEVRHLADDKRPILQKGSVDVFVMSVPRSLGQLNYLRIWHDNSGSGKWSSWFCQYIVFRDVQTGYKYEFLLNKWLAVEHDDGMIDRLVPVAGREQVTEFSHLFSTASRKNLADSHLWFSVFLRPPRSRFTRVQRTCCCMATICLSMLANAMYYERTSAKPASGGFKFGPLSLSPEQIGVGLITNFLIFPPTFLMIFFFRKSRPRNLRPSRIENALKCQRAEWKKQNPAPPLQPSLKQPRKSDAELGPLRPRKRKFSLPWWCVGFGWLLVVTSIAVSLFFLWAYGISFGDEKTSKWLSSLLVAFVSSVLITQPLKILLMAIVVSCICKSMDYDEDDSDEDEEDPHLSHDEEYLHDQRRTASRGAAYRPMDTEALEEARKEREKEVKMYSVLREISAYFMFLWVIMILSYGNRDPNNFFLREALINGFVKPGDLWVDYNNVNTERRFWNWTHNALVPELFALPWYNGNDPLGLRLYLDDRNNLKIGYAVLRQVRIQPRNCKVSWLIESITPECAGFGSVAFEDGTLYTKGWRTVNSTDTLVPPEYKYLTAAQLRGYPFWGQLDWYGGGGYVVPLVARRDSDVKSLMKRVKRLEKDGWIDRHTRAVFVEFGVYNAQINLFCAVTILAEFLPGGGVVPYYHIDPIRLLNYHTGFGFFQLAIEVIFVIFTIFFTIRELKGICREGRSYFGQYWNIAELVSVTVSYTGIANHIYKMFVTAEILHVFTSTEGTGYVKLQEAVLLNELFCYQIGLVMSISTLKFLKLLRFNKRIGILSSTLRMCAKELKSYSVCLLVVFTAFVTLFWLLLGRSVRAFCTFASSFESSISMMLKKFDYDAMYTAQPVLAPIAFFTFSLATALVLVNILLSIIIRSFENVKHDSSMQSNEYEILEFFINRLKMVTGCGKGTKVRPAPSMYRDKKDIPKDSVSTFPAKVDRLVDFINDFYFENQMDFSGKEFLKKLETAKLETKKAKPIMANKSKIPKSVAGRFDDF